MAKRRSFALEVPCLWLNVAVEITKLWLEIARVVKSFGLLVRRMKRILKMCAAVLFPVAGQMRVCRIHGGYGK